MYQQEIKFFWPLTEQIPLDLDYSVCDRSRRTVSSSIIDSCYTIRADWNTTNTTIIAGNLNLDVDTTVIKVKEKPTLLRRMLYNGLGLKWEIK